MKAARVLNVTSYFLKKMIIRTGKITSSDSKWTPSDRPIMYAIRRMYFSFPSSSAFSRHRRASQTTTARKNMLAP